VNERADVALLGPDDVPSVVDVLCESFHDYPVMRFVLGPDCADYDQALSTLVHFFVMARVFRNETLLGLRDGADLVATALVSRPSGAESPSALRELGERVWGRLGPAAGARYMAFGAACAHFEIEVPHIHLNMIGVRRAAQGGGYGRTLLDHVHGLSRSDPASEGVTLSTEVEDNVRLYEHFGYEVLGHQEVAPGVETWGLYRRD